MKVGIIVEGVSEYGSLGEIFNELSDRSGNTFLKVVRGDIDPIGPCAVMAKKSSHLVRQLEARGAELIVIVLDREQRPDCPGKICQQIAAEFGRYAGTATVQAVLKDRTYENWLAAASKSLKSQNKRFKLSKADVRKVAPNKADSVDGADFFRKVTLGDYDKVADSKRILKKAAVAEIADNSRSFRRFLRIIGDPAYSAQSRHP
jgi:hypothetical protein